MQEAYDTDFLGKSQLQTGLTARMAIRHWWRLDVGCVGCVGISPSLSSLAQLFEAFDDVNSLFIRSINNILYLDSPVAPNILISPVILPQKLRMLILRITF